MAITTKSRKDLKSYFVKNAIPTEGNFADLIDAPLNQSDDGVFKLTGEPLSVVAASGDQKRVLRLYANYPAANPDWLINLNPAQDPANSATNRPGFGIADGAGNTRLFIDPGTGNLGVGTNNPADRLTVQEGDVRIEGGRYRRLKIVSDKYWAGIELVTREQGEAGNPHIDFTHGQLDAPNFGIRVAAETNNALVVSAGAGNATLDVRGLVQASGLVSTPGGLMFEGLVAHIDRDGALYRNTDGQCYLTVDDNFYIRDVASSTWAAQFDTNSGSLNLKGNLTANRIRGLNTLTLNDYQTANPSSNVFLHSPPSDRDAWIYLDSADTASNWGIYHRQIDSAVAGLPGNAIGFVGGGTSKLQAYVSLYDGSAYFAGNLAFGGDVAMAGKHAFRANDSWLRLNQDGAFTSGVHTPGNFAPNALNVGGVNSWGNPGAGNAWIGGTITVKGAITPSAGNTETTGIMFPPDPFGGGGDRAWIRYHNARGGEKTTLEIGIANDGDDHILLNPSGNVGIGVAEPTSKLDVAGAYIAVRGAGNEHGYIGGDGGGNDVQVGSLAAGVINVSIYNPTLGYMDLYARRFQPASDARLKENIEPITGGLEKLLKLRSVSFDWKGAAPDEPGRRSLGLVAQEVREVLPEVVVEARQGTLTIDYNAILAVAIEALKEQQSQITELRKGLQQLQARLDKPPAAPKKSREPQS